MNVIQINAMFSTRPLTPEQAERLQAVRQGAGALAMLMVQTTVDSPIRQIAVDKLRESFAMIEHAIALEQQGGRDTSPARIKFLNQLRGKISQNEYAKLAAMLGLIEMVEEEDKKLQGAS